MSYNEAIEDGIPMEKDSHKNMWYYPPCKICGAPVPLWKYVRGVDYVCKECRAYAREQARLEKDALQTDKKEKRLENAVKRISKITDIGPYQPAIEQVRKKIGTPGWFQSTEEVMTALELLRRGVVVHHQVKIYEYSVDFVIPKYRVALEIDGRPFHRREDLKKQQIRDEVVVMKLGEGWQVIHIDSENINTNVTKLLPAIEAVLRERNKKATSVHPSSP